MKKMIGLLALVLAFGCAPQETPQELVLLCGSSFAKPTEKLIQEFFKETGVKVVTSVAGSEDFLPLIKTKAKGDILVTHDPFLEYVKEAGALFDHVQVGALAPVLAVQKGNPKKLSALQDLLQPNLKLALPNPEYSTCGQMIYALLEKKGIKEKILKNVGNRLTKGHGDLGNLLKTRTVDAVIMWNGVAHTFRQSLDRVTLPYEYEEEIRVHVMGLSYSKNKEMIKTFMEFIRKRGEAVFREHGYVK